MSFVVTLVGGILNHLPSQKIYRYMGMNEDSADATLQELVESKKALFLDKVRCKACYGIVPVKVDGTHVDLTLFSVESTHLARNLRNCEYAVLFAATLGTETEQQWRRAAAVSSVDALALDAIGSAGIEQFCDQLCDHLAQMNSEYKMRPRFSPGYGDFPLDTQEQLLQILDAQRKIGVSLTDGFLMIPQKSVTAIVGFSKDGCDHVFPDCENCDHEVCEFRL